MTFNFGSISQSIFNISRRNTLEVGTRIERLSSALRINKGSDDPSGLAISKGMTAHIRGTAVATQNLQDGISMIQTQDGGLAEIQDILLRMRDLTLRGANEAILTTADRQRIQIELDGLAKEITRSAGATTFNGKNILTGEIVPGNYKISFISNRSGSANVHIMDSLGGNPVQLTTDGAMNGRNEISPDGSMIVFNSQRSGNREIYIMDKYGENETNITNSPGADRHPDWSPDGSKIVFSSSRDGDYDIYVMNKDGSGVTKLFESAGLDRAPQWSPDGSEILFSSDMGGSFELYTIDYDGTNLQKLTDTPLAQDDEWYGYFSPDGKQIFYHYLTGAGGQGEIYVMNSDGTGLYQLSADKRTNCWSPTGESILASDQQEIYRIGIDGSYITNLTNNPAADLDSWEGSPGPEEYYLQIGPDSENFYQLAVTLRDMRARAIGVGGVSVLTQKAAQIGVELVDHGLDVVGNYRSEIGQTHGKLQKVANDLSAAYINVSAANSRIEDADMAVEMTEMTKALLKQTSTDAMATHANNLYEGAVKLIGIVEEA